MFNGKTDGKVLPLSIDDQVSCGLSGLEEDGVPDRRTILRTARHGFKIVERGLPIRRRIVLQNALMRKQL